MEEYPGIQQILEMYCQSVELQSTKRSVDAVMEVPKDLTHFGDFFDLRDRISGKHYDFPAQGAAISEKTADLLGLKVGDTVQMKKVIRSWKWRSRRLSKIMCGILFI